MKVLLDNQIFDSQKFGGISRYFRELSSDNDAISFIEPYVEPSYTFNERIARKLNKIVFNRSFQELTKEQHNINTINNSEFDLFHPTYYGNYFLDKINKPYVLTVYDMIHEKFAEYFGMSNESIDKYKLCMKASKIIAISNSTKRDLVDIFGIPEEKIEVTYLATNYHELVGSMPSINFEENRFILFTGNRSAYKNFLFFLQAITPILKSNNDLILICTGSEFNDIELKWLKDLNIKDKVLCHFCNSDTELVYLYQNAECFIFPSLYEGFGIPILEAFACKCPVVSSPGGSLKEIGGDAVIYFDPKDIKQLRESILLVLSDNSLRKELIAAGETRLNDFSWDKCRKETNHIYESVAQGGLI